MTVTGDYADRRTYALPRGWDTVPEELLETATAKTLVALRDPETPARLAAYYDPAGDYAGTTFLDASPNDPLQVTAADLWAVTTLSMPVHARQGRRLFDDPDTRSQVQRHLRRLDPDAALTDLDHALTDASGGQGALDVMWDLYDTFRTLLANDDSDSSHWVFAAKLCARKRPNLFPVRDHVVCGFLSGGKPLGKQLGRLGWFYADLQTYAWLITHPQVRHALERLREATTAQGVRVDEPPLKLLDAALWMQANLARRS